MERKSIVAAAIIAAGLIAGGIMIPWAAKINRSYDRTVSVKGLCEREVKADNVIWPITVKVSGNDLKSVLSELEAKNAIAKSFLKEGGISDSEITSTMTVSDKNTQDYNNERSQRFIAKSVITVCSKNVDAVIALMERKMELMESGVAMEEDWDNKTQFSFESLNEIKPQMIEEATVNAREVAEKFAKDSQSRLGKIRDANQGTFSITDRDSYNPQIKKVRVVTSVTYYLSN